MKIINKNNKIKRKELQIMAEKMFGSLVKAVVDINKEIIAVDAPMHADQEAYLIEKGSKQKDLWGINLYPKKSGNKFIEFDSVINLRPNQNNRSRSVDDPNIRQKITKIIDNLVQK